MKLNISRLSSLALILATAALAACGSNQPNASQSTPLPPQAKSALAGLTPNSILAHIKVLASDEFEGRAPASPGEDKTVNYLVSQFKSIGLQPGNPNGTFIQDVPMVGFTSQPSGYFTAAGQRLDLRFPADAVLWTSQSAPQVTLENSDIVFVGYGVVAPEYGWDDFKGVDVRGKTIVMLVNDPPVPDPKDPTKLDPAMFKGNAMTYYGRWTYKYEIAAAKGAAAALVVHQTIPAAYPWEVVVGSNSRENFDLQDAESEQRLTAQGWITVDTARKLCSTAGQDFATLEKAAARKDFRPVALDAKASFTVKTVRRAVASRNVIGKVEGSDPILKNEYIVYTAHWDHLGRDTTLQGDQIFNGAADNASGCAALIELARAFAIAKPKRSVLFLSVTGEEKGLLGSRFYATHPLYPLDHTLADINMDVLNTWGRTRDVGVVGQGQSTLEDTLAAVVKAHGRTLVGEAEPEKGHFFRSDHFEFAKQGVPALYMDKGLDYLGRPAGWGQQKRNEYVTHDYHKVSDEIKPDWDLTGAVEDVGLLFEVGYTVAQGDKYPQWKAGSEFKARREAMMKR
jgi:Zn-dependent M28 family amino/carboxypeptidase